IGGVLSCNLSGPRRLKAGAARDHFLGFKAVSGRGEAFQAGGRVVKNVTGYDLCKLMAGAYGTFVALTEVNVKVLPAPEKTAPGAHLRPRPPPRGRGAGAGVDQPPRGLRCRTPARSHRCALGCRFRRR